MSGLQTDYKTTEVLQQLIDFLADLTRVGKENINLDTRIFEDLRADGDDAFEILEWLETKFGLSASDFPFEQYFHGEYDYWGIGEFVGNFVKKIFVEDFKPKEYKSLTVREIDASVRAGKWELD